MVGGFGEDLQSRPGRLGRLIQCQAGLGFGLEKMTVMVGGSPRRRSASQPFAGLVEVAAGLDADGVVVEAAPSRGGQDEQCCELPYGILQPFEAVAHLQYIVVRAVVESRRPEPFRDANGREGRPARTIPLQAHERARIEPAPEHGQVLLRRL
jgi:hypothetical protein